MTGSTRLKIKTTIITGKKTSAGISYTEEHSINFDKDLETNIIN